MKIVIIINSSRANAEIQENINTALLDHPDITYDLFFKSHNEIENCFLNLNIQTYNAIIVGGGDGTIRLAAEILSQFEVPLAILPLGTFNVLARDLNYSNDIPTLFNIVKNYKIKKIDLAEVNGHIFINHSWIGFYSKILKLRKKYKNFLGTSKLLKIIFTAFNFFKPLPIYSLEIDVNEKAHTVKTCLVYIGNNDHHTNLLDFGEKSSLSTGVLSINILNCHSRLQLCQCAFSILFNRFKESKYITKFLAKKAEIYSKMSSINIVVDGEVLNLNTPLIYTINQKQLSVIVP